MKNPNQISMSLPPEYRAKAVKLAKKLNLMSPTHPNEPSLSKLFQHLIDKESDSKTGADFLKGLDDDDKWKATGGRE